MREVFRVFLLSGILGTAIAQPQNRREILPANPKLVPRDFTFNDETLSLKFTAPFKLYINGREIPAGWHLEKGRTMWLGLSQEEEATLSR
jgi:hypothetical protein